MKDMRIYVASLSDYNNGRLEGKWLDLADYSDASELMEAIQEMLDALTEKYKSVDGEVREEWAVHDYEGIPSTLASEYMSEQDFQQLYDIAEVADDRGVPVEVLVERAGDTGSDDYQALADSLMFVVDGYDESDIVAEYESQIGDLGSDFWSNHIYIDDVTERVMYGEDVDRFREDILYENPDLDEDEAERQAEEMADEEAERREDLTTYLEDMGYGDSIPDFVSKDYEGAWKRSLSYDFDVINHDGEMYVFSNNYSLGGTILSGMIGAYIGYKIGRAKPQKKGFETEKKIGRKIKGALTKKKMARGGGVYSSDTMYELKVFDGKSNDFLTLVRYRARNQREANELGQDYEYEMQQKYGDYLRFVVSEAKPLMARGGGVSERISKAKLKAKLYKPTGDFFIEDKGDKWYIHFTPKDASKNSSNLSDLNATSVGNGYYGSAYSVDKVIKHKYAESGNVNTGRSWHQDRRMHNKSERYEKPMNSRKKQFAKGGLIRELEQKEFEKFLDNLEANELSFDRNKAMDWLIENRGDGYYESKPNKIDIDKYELMDDLEAVGIIQYGGDYAKGGGVNSSHRYDALVHFLTNDGENMEKEYIIPSAFSEEDAENQAIEKFYREDFDRYDAEQIQYISLHKREKSFAKGGGVEDNQLYEYAVTFTNGIRSEDITRRVIAKDEDEALSKALQYKLTQFGDQDYNIDFISRLRYAQYAKEYAKGGGVDEEKIWEIIYKDRGVQKSILVEGYSHILEENNWRNKNPTKEFIQIRLYGNKHSKGGGISGLDDLIRG